MTDESIRLEIQKIEENIRALEKMKAEGIMPAGVAEASITALRKEQAPIKPNCKAMACNQ